MALIFSVVGARHDDPDQLLLIDDDGVYYHYDVTRDSAIPVEPDDVWVVDAQAGDDEGMTAN